LGVERATRRRRDHFDLALLSERSDCRGGIAIFKDQRRWVSPGRGRSGCPNDSEAVQSPPGRVLELRSTDRHWKGRATESQHATVGRREVDPIYAKLKLVIEDHIVESGLNLDLAVGALVHAGEVILHPFQRGGPVGDLNDASGLVDREGRFARRSEHRPDLFCDLLPEIHLVVSRQVHGRTADAKGGTSTAAAAAATAAGTAAAGTAAAGTTAGTGSATACSTGGARAERGRTFADAVSREAQIINVEQP